MDGVKQVLQQHDSSGEDDSAVGEEWQVGGGGDWKRLEDDADCTRTITRTPQSTPA